MLTVDHHDALARRRWGECLNALVTSLSCCAIRRSPKQRVGSKILIVGDDGRRRFEWQAIGEGRGALPNTNRLRFGRAPQSNEPTVLEAPYQQHPIIVGGGLIRSIK
jgi:hypothetical protein